MAFPWKHTSIHARPSLPHLYLNNSSPALPPLRPCAALQPGSLGPTCVCFPPVPYLNIGFIHRWGLGGVVEMREERKGGGVLGWVGWEVGL
jgi:hypothetical protein